MKSNIFNMAIENRFRLRFLYNLHEIIIEPYLITKNKNGKKVIYGRVNATNEIKTFEFDRILNIKTLNYSRFSPLIPIMSKYN